MAGLERRRKAESALYLTPVHSLQVIEEPEDEPDMPQTVDAERPMTQSSINRSAVVAGGTAAVATVAETARTVADVKYSAMALGDWLVPILLVVVVALCGFILYERIKVRRDGWH